LTPATHYPRQSDYRFSIRSAQPALLGRPAGNALRAGTLLGTGYAPL